MKKWERSRAKKTAAAAGSASIQSFFKPKSAKGGPVASSQQPVEVASQRQSQREPSVRLRPPSDSVDAVVAASGVQQQPRQAVREGQQVRARNPFAIQSSSQSDTGGIGGGPSLAFTQDDEEDGTGMGVELSQGPGIVRGPCRQWHERSGSAPSGRVRAGCTSCGSR